VADAIDELWRQPEARLREWGEQGRRRVADIGWDHVIDTLTAALR
jgi:hypothetical protein